MLDLIGSAAVLHPMLQVNIGSPVDAGLVSQVATQPSPVSGTGATVTDALLIDPIVISRAVLHAESMIAALLGVKSHEVRVSVNTKRYEY